MARIISAFPRARRLVIGLACTCWLWRRMAAAATIPEVFIVGRRKKSWED
jgi:hypothetical protein